MIIPTASICMSNDCTISRMSVWYCQSILFGVTVILLGTVSQYCLVLQVIHKVQQQAPVSIMTFHTLAGLPVRMMRLLEVLSTTYAAALCANSACSC